jgi:hypothetical protein
LPATNKEKEMKEALKLALEALEEADEIEFWNKQKQAIIAIKEALAQPEQSVAGYCKKIEELIVERDHWKALAQDEQPEQEPVASYLPEMSIPNFSARVAWGAPDHIDLRNGWRPLYTTPAQRPWVGLTAQEAADCWTTSATQTWHNFEAALKEKNDI